MTTVEIALIFSTPLDWMSQSQEEGKLVSGILQNCLNAWRTDMGLPVEFKIVLKPEAEDKRGRQGYSPSGFSVWIDDYRCAYSRYLIDLVYRQVLEQPVYVKSARLSDVQAWLARGAAQHQVHSDLKKQAIYFIAHLSAEAVINSAAALVNQAFAKAFLVDCRVELPPSLVQKVLRFLLSFHISLREKDLINKHIHRAVDAQLPAQAVAEDLYSQLRPGNLELRLKSKKLSEILDRSKVGHHDPSDGDSFLIDDLKPEYAQALKTRLNTLNERYKSANGCYLQEIKLVAADNLTKTAFQLRFNHRVMPTQYMMAYIETLGPDLLTVSNTLLKSLEQMQKADVSVNNVSADVEQVPNQAVEQFSIDRQRLLASIDYQNFILEALKQFDAELTHSYQAHLNQQKASPPVSFKPYLFAEVVTSAIARLIQSICPLVLTAEDVEYQLAQLHSAKPASSRPAQELVKSTYLSGHTPVHLAPIIRYLLRQDMGIGLNLRNLHFILETLLQQFNESVHYSCITGIGIPSEFSTFQPWDDSPTGSRQTYRSVAESIRVHWAQQYFELIDKNTQLSLSCYRLHPDIEKKLSDLVSLQASAEDAVATDLSLQILWGITHHVKQFALTSGIPSILIESSAEAALLLHDLISADYPDIQIFHRDLLNELVKIEVVSIIPDAKSM